MSENSVVIRAVRLVLITFPVSLISFASTAAIQADYRACLELVTAKDQAKCFVAFASKEFDNSHPKDPHLPLLLGVTQVLSGHRDNGIKLISDAPAGAPVYFRDKADALAKADMKVLARQAYRDAADKLFDPELGPSLTPWTVASLGADMASNGFPKLAVETIRRYENIEERKYFSTARQLIDLGTPEAMEALVDIEKILIERAQIAEIRRGPNNFVTDARFLFNWGRTATLEEISRILAIRLETQSDERSVRRICYNVGSTAAYAGRFDILEKVNDLAPYAECEWAALYRIAAIRAFRLGRTDMYEKFLSLIKKPEHQVDTIVRILNGRFNATLKAPENIDIEPSRHQEMIRQAMSFANKIQPKGVVATGPKQFKEIAETALEFGEREIARNAADASYEIAEKSLDKKSFQGFVMRDLFSVWARLGETEKIQQLTITVDDFDFQSFGRRAVAEKFLREGNRDAAFRTAKLSQPMAINVLGTRLVLSEGRSDKFVLRVLAESALKIADAESLGLAIRLGCCDNIDLQRLVYKARDTNRLNVFEDTIHSFTGRHTTYIQFVISDHKAKEGNPFQMISLLSKLDNRGRVCGLTRLALYQMGRADILNTMEGHRWNGSHCVSRIMK